MEGWSWISEGAAGFFLQVRRSHFFQERRKAVQQLHICIFLLIG